MVSVRDVHSRSVASFNAAYAEESAAYQRAHQQGDVDEMSRAACSMAGLRASLKELNQMAVEATMPPAPPPGSDDLSYRDQNLARKYALDATALAVAKGWTADPNLSDEDKVRTYIEQRAKYRHMVATGQYVNQTNPVGKG